MAEDAGSGGGDIRVEETLDATGQLSVALEEAQKFNEMIEGVEARIRNAILTQ